MSTVQGQGINTINDQSLLSKEIKTNDEGTVQKVINFINDNKSLIFFGATLLFSYFMTPLYAFEYFNFFDTFVGGVIFGTTALIIKNLVTSLPMTKDQDDKINYLAGIANLGEIYLCPACALVTSISTAGFIAIKTIFNNLFAAEDQKLLHKDKAISFLV